MRTTTFLASLAALLTGLVSAPALAQDEEDPYADEEPAEEAAKETETTGAEEPGTGSEPSLAEQASGEAPAEEGSLRRSGRMEFDERVVKGQAAKSGAVYLFKRVPRQLPGLVPLRRSYRRRIVEPVLGQRALKPAVYSSAPAAADKKEKKKAAPEPKPSKGEAAAVEETEETETKPKPEREKKRSRRKRRRKK
jgi:hypothetical protein